jgi:radical SAM superfamily enzyme YgiQ (UPF0313 family)
MMDKKILLINPRATYVNEIAQKCYPPMSLLYLASALRKKHFEPIVLDANAFHVSDTEIIDCVKRERPLVVGISLYSDILPQVYNILKQIRGSCPNTTLVLGGPHATALPSQTLEEYFMVDYVLTGEAEETLPQLCEALTTNTPVDYVPGIVYRKNKQVIEGPPYQLPKVEAIPLPARDLVEKAYAQKLYYTLMVRQRPVDTLFTSRGCPFKCGFCYNFRQQYRGRSPEDIVNELVTIRERGIRDIEICDDTFTAARSRAITILDLIIREKLDVSFRIKSRVDVFTEELAQKASQAGVYLVAFGMESGSQDILDRMNKKTTVAQNARACELTRRYRMLSHSSWVIGFPGETRDTIQETLRFILKSKPSTVNIAVLRPYPNTEVFFMAKESNCLVGSWSPHNKNVPWVRLPWITDKKELDDICKKMMKRVYFSNYYALSFAFRILKNLNWTLARYAAQETMKLIPRKKFGV